VSAALKLHQAAITGCVCSQPTFNHPPSTLSDVMSQHIPLWLNGGLTHPLVQCHSPNDSRPARMLLRRLAIAAARGDIMHARARKPAILVQGVDGLNGCIRPQTHPVGSYLTKPPTPADTHNIQTLIQVFGPGFQNRHQADEQGN